jgi:small subunit ribosomal protein S13
MTLFSNVLPKTARVHSALALVYGVGPNVAGYLCSHWGIGYDRRVEDLSMEVRASRVRELERGIRVFDRETGENELLVLEKDLRREVQGTLDRLKVIHCYRGVRHQAGLPCHGQRTRTNGSKRLRVSKIKALHAKRLSSKKGKKIIKVKRQEN